MDAGHDAQERTGRLARRFDRRRRDHGVTPPDGTSRAVADALADALARADRADGDGRTDRTRGGDRPAGRSRARGPRPDSRAHRTVDGLRAHGWTSLHDLHWPGRPGVLLDEIVIGPGGVVVVDGSRWSADLTVTAGLPHQGGRVHDRELHALVDAVAAVTALVGPAHRSAVTAVVCPPGAAGPVRTSAGLLVVGRERLGAHLAGLPVRLSPYDVADLGRRLSRELGGRVGPDLLTTAALDQPDAAAGSVRPGTRGSRARVAARTEAVTAPTRTGLRRAVRRADLVALALLAAVVVTLGVDPASLATAGSAVGDFVASWVVPETLLPGALPDTGVPLPGGAGPVTTS
ncbi:hypothetical protein [Cellulomonas cellasea]|uniref:NERD domain-containing protein n=1 Tax=Cellulomonas cellasea TaxID=43670 RepID=A0A7W4UJ05_9CELL|nr:hypothetical protein [Cellulomonas cellasea]MBB2924408.1 hypothetical protein [Cellulomonas cellasea]